MEKQVQSVGFKLTVIFTILSVIVFVFCLVNLTSSNNDYNIARADALWANYENTSNDETYSEREFNKLDIARKLYIAGIVVSIIVFISCIYIVKSTNKKKNTVIQPSNPKSITNTERLKELSEMLNTNLITQAEYDEKKKEVLSRI